MKVAGDPTTMRGSLWLWPTFLRGREEHQSLTGLNILQAGWPIHHSADSCRHSMGCFRFTRNVPRRVLMRRFDTQCRLAAPMQSRPNLSSKIRLSGGSFDIIDE